MSGEKMFMVDCHLHHKTKEMIIAYNAFCALKKHRQKGFHESSGVFNVQY